MANQLTPNAKQKFSDANGDPLAGGKLYTYVAGTVNPATTYVSLNGAANANPIILNANGECDLWLTDGNSYKFELKNSSDVSQWTVDNIETSSAEADTVVTKTTTYTAVASDDIILVETAAAWTLSLFTAVGNSGKLLRIVKTSNDQNELTIDASGSETINGFLTMKLKYRFDEVTLISNGSGWNIHAQIKSPTIQRFTSGSPASYTAPNAVKYLKVKMVGGGGGGGGGGAGAGGSSGGGGISSEFYFDVPMLIAGTGAGGTRNGGVGGAGGTNTITAGAVAIVNVAGGAGANGTVGVAGLSLNGGPGGGSVYGSSHLATSANSGQGGQGGTSVGANNAGGGGGAGGYLEAIIYNPQSTAYTYTVGGGGFGGVGDGGGNGYAGAAGVIVIEEHYQ